VLAAVQLIIDKTIEWPIAMPLKMRDLVCDRYALFAPRMSRVNVNCKSAEPTAVYIAEDDAECCGLQIVLRSYCYAEGISQTINVHWSGFPKSPINLLNAS